MPVFDNLEPMEPLPSYTPPGRAGKTRGYVRVLEGVSGGIQGIESYATAFFL